MNFYGFVDESAVEKPGIVFGGQTIAPIAGHVGDDPNQKAAVKKWNGTPDSTARTTYDATKNAEQFTIEIDTTGNTKPVDIDVTDVVKFDPANVIDNNKAWTVDIDEAAAAGLTTSFTKSADGTYVWSIKQMPKDTKYKLTYWVYLDSANSTGNFSFTNKATPEIGGTAFTPATTDGVEQHQFNIAKRNVAKVSYDPATGKATATYEVKVTANANNSGTASNVSVVDTFKTGGKYVTDVKQTSPDGTISDKAQSGDNYSFKWNIGSIAPGETKTLTYTAEFDPDTLYFGADQGSKNTKDIKNEAKVYEGADTDARATASASQRVDNQQATKGYEFDIATGKLKFTIVFNGKIPGTNNYFDSVLTNFTDQIQTAGVTYADITPVLEAFNDSGVQKIANLTDANIAGNSSFNIAIPQDMKGPYSYRLTYYVNVPDGIDPSTVIRNTMAAQGVGINGTSPFSLTDKAEATVADTYSASLKKTLVGFAEGPEGDRDRVRFTIDVTSSLPAGATLKDTASISRNGNSMNAVFENVDMLDPDVTKICIVDAQGNVQSTLVRGVDYDLTWDNTTYQIKFLNDVTGISDSNRIRVFYQIRVVPTEQQIQEFGKPKDNANAGIEWTTVDNKAELDVNGLGATSSARADFGGKFKKEFAGYDSTTRQLAWKVSYPYEYFHLLTGERTVTEYISEDQTFVKATDRNGNPLDCEVSPDGKRVTCKVKVTDDTNGIFVTFYTTLNEQYLIEHGYDPDNLVDYQTKNLASTSGLDAPVYAQATGTITETGTLTKDYTYSNVTEEQKGGIEFELNVNPHASDLDPGSDTLVIQDTMNRNLVLDPDSVRINGQTVADFGQGADLRYDRNSNHFQLVVPDGVACNVTYTAKIVGVVAGESGWLSNTARIEGRPGTATVDKASTKRLEVGAGAFKAVPFFVKKLDGDDNLVSGATFDLKRLELKDGQLVEVDAIDTEGEVVTTSNDNLDGTYRWINLLPTTPALEGGKGYVYVIRETAAPTGCQLDTTPKYVYFEEPSQEMTDAMTAAGMQATKVKGGGGNDVKGMFSFKDENNNDTVNVTADKVWNDNDNSEGFRPSAITINLIKNYDTEHPLDTVQVKADKNGNWTYTFENLPKYETKDAQRSEVAYTITEDPVKEYTTVVSGSAADGYTVANTHEVAKVKVDGLKFWNDGSDAAGKRPGKITVGVFADDSEQPLETKEITAADNASAADSNYWIYTFDNLNKYKDDGKRTPIKYTVKEIGTVDFYASAQDGTADNNYTVKNDFTGKTISVEKVDDQGNPVTGAELMVEKVNETDPGDGGGDEGGLDVEALDDGATTTIENWTTDGNAHELTLAPGNYVLSEANAPTGYQASDPIYFTVNEDGSVTLTGTVGEVTGDKLNIIKMTDARSTLSLKVNKVWNDAENADGVRPDSISVQLMADGVNKGEAVTVKADKNGNWTHTFTNLVEFNADGSKINYTVDEVNPGEGYTASAPVYATDDNGNKTAEITNTHQQELTELPVSKIWDDEDDLDSVRPGSVELGVYDADNVTAAAVTGDPVAKATVTKAMAEAGNANVWKYTFTNLPKNKMKNGASTAINYVVRELDENGKAQLNNTLTANPDYSVTYNDEAKTVTNYNPPKKIDIAVTKAWNDDGNRDGVQPKSVTVRLKADGNLMDPDQTVTLNKDNNWTASFKQLIANKKVGGKTEAIDYTVVEDEVEGYTAVITGTAATGYTVTNTHELAKTEVPCTKVWDDVNNQDGKRLDSVTFGVFDIDDENTAIQTVTLNADNKKADNDNVWEYTFTNLLKNKVVDGKSQAIKYVVRELDANGKAIAASGKLADYTVTYNADGNEVTNTYKPATADLEGTKTWEDNANQDGVRPVKIHVKVMNGNKVAAEKDIEGDSTAKTWSYKFTGLPLYENGNKITYHVEETAAVGYETQMAAYETDIKGTNITNTHTPEEVSVSGSKVWNDANNQDGVRPDTVKMGVFDSDDLNTAKQTKELSKTQAVAGNANEWTCKFNNLPKYKDAGTEIKYVVREVGADDKAIADDAKDVTGEYTVKSEGNKVTNTHKVEKTQVKVTKKWADVQDQDGKRPETLTVNLLADGKIIKTQVLNIANETTDEGTWEYTFEGLDKYAAKDNANEATTPINYTVSENAVKDYSSELVGPAPNFTFTNSYTPGKKNVTVTKIWEDKGNQDGIRPASITIALTADGEATGKTVTLNKENGWTDSFKNLPEMKNHGQVIKYAVTEETVEGYQDANIKAMDTATAGAHYAYQVTNTHEVEKTSVDVTKVWNDRDNKEGKRNAYLEKGIKLQLLANGDANDPRSQTVVVKPGDAGVTTDDQGNWHYTFADLDKNEWHADEAQSVPVEYTVKELGVDQKVYQSEVTGTQAEGYTVTNSEVTRGVLLSKTDAGFKAVAGATMQVKDADGNVKATWTSKAKSHELQLKPGEYTLEETKAPVGYEMAQPVPFTVNEDGTVTFQTPAGATVKENEALMVDELSDQAVKVAKVDENGKALAGAKLSVTGTDAAGKAIEEMTWTTTGTAHALNLKAGHYKLTELAVPDKDKYLKADDIDFEVTLDGKVLVNGKAVKSATVTMVDKFAPGASSTKTTVAKTFMPTTGDPLSMMMLLGLFGLAGLAAIMAAVARRKKGDSQE